MTTTRASRLALPEFADDIEHREYIRDRLAAGFRIFHKLGFNEGVMGHLSARDPIDSNLFWLNPFGVSFGDIRSSDLQLVDHEGNLVEGEGMVHPGAMILHPDIYSAHPGIQSIGHTHSPYGRVLSTLGRRLDPITNESAIFFDRHALYDSHANGEGANLARSMRARDRALVMANHGIVTFGQTVDEMIYLFLSLEKSCQIQVQAEAAGTPRVLDDSVAESIAARLTHHIAWLNFQPTFADITREQPDLLD
jgi:ribulose-5-phosphate 4-epimerase/fuculose-1-phosphate aldolase